MFKIIVLILMSFGALAQTPQEILEKSDENISLPTVKIIRTVINGGRLATVAKTYIRDGKIFSMALFPPKYVGNKFIRDDGKLLYYISRQDKLIKMPKYVTSMQLMGTVMYMEDNSMVDYLAKYDAISMKEEQKNGYSTYAIELQNRESESVFPKRMVWIDKKTYLPIFQVMYDKNGKVVKNIEVKKIAKQGEYNYIKESLHIDPENKERKIEYFIDNIKINANVPNVLFSKMSLS